MKKILLPILSLFFTSNVVNAQTSEYNKWSIELNGGMSKAFYNYTDGYSSKNAFSHAGFGVRYMANNKFGLKASVNYDNIKNAKNSPNFSTDVYRYNLEGVINLGRVLTFEDWTNTIGLLVHGGAGYTTFHFDNFPDRKDGAINLMFGITPQIRLGNRVALTLDVTAINNFKQKYTWDGNHRPDNDIKASGTVSVDGETGTVDISVPDPSKKFLKHLNPMLNTTVGLTFYLGNKPTHADWYKGNNNKITNRLDELENKLMALQNDLVDSDNDGVADYLDLEPNTPAGNMVNVRGVSIDLNKNGVPDSYEVYFADVYGKKEKPSQADIETAKDLINDGYIAMYFDFNKSQPKNSDALSFVLNYLKANPNASVEVNGYADSVGNANYNKTLSDKRAENVAKMLEDSGISSSRIKVVAKGVDSSLDGNNKVASQFARKVTFKVN